MTLIKSPYGAATAIVLLATGTTALIITNQDSYVATPVVSTGNCTVNLTIDSQVTAGAKLKLQGKGTGTETITFGTGIVAPVITNAAGKTWTQEFWYDGTRFIPSGAKIQID